MLKILSNITPAAIFFPSTTSLFLSPVNFSQTFAVWVLIQEGFAHTMSSYWCHSGTATQGEHRKTTIGIRCLHSSSCHSNILTSPLSSQVQTALSDRNAGPSDSRDHPKVQVQPAELTSIVEQELFYHQAAIHRIIEFWVLVNELIVLFPRGHIVLVRNVFIQDFFGESYSTFDEVSMFSQTPRKHKHSKGRQRTC